MSNTAMLEAQTDFGLRLLSDTVANSGKASVVLSPLSVAIALSMAYAGAKDQTEQELNQMLAKGAPKEQVHEYFGALISKIYAPGKNYTLETANRIYVKNNFPILDSYKQVLDAHYRGQFEAVDFSQSVATAKKINDFVSNATHDKIHDLIQPDSLTALTRLVLVNAVYFKGNWLTKFEPKQTQAKAFYVAEGNEKQVDMMRNTDKFIYDENDKYQVLGLPYSGSEVFMFIVLPRERYGLETVLRDLTAKELLEVFQKRHKEEVVVSLPKFKLESTHELTRILAKNGLSKSLTPQANFRGIADADLQISEVIQKAFIEVNEQGTEAAAATVVQLETMSAMDGPSPPEFRADHPFAYFVADNGGNALFSGVLCQ